MKKKLKMAFGAIALALFGASGAYWKLEVKDYQEIVMFFDVPIKTIVAVGDTGEPGPHRDIVKKAIAKECPQVVLGLGDVSYPDGVNSWEEFEKDVYNFYNDLCPAHFSSLIVSGNHEHYASKEREWLAKFIFPKKVYGSIVYPNYYYGMIYENVCFLALESSVYEVKIGDPKIQKRMEKFAKRFLEDGRCKGKKKIAFAHHPIYSSGDHGNATSGDYKEFYEEVLKNKVDYFFAGHDHNLSIEKVDGKTKHFVSGSGAKIRDCKRKGPHCISAYGYITLDLETGAKLVPVK